MKLFGGGVLLRLSEIKNDMKGWFGALGFGFALRGLLSAAESPEGGVGLLPDGETGVLICFKCSELAIYGAMVPQNKVKPFPSPVVESLMNRLLDKHKVERDDPKKRGATKE
ncbi:hypothetical protein [Verrucomicrobium spinosum]|uniref:hypothetical protein n=1 Tax=Verrucomicrobium spinosum TaxID=2736 RepID=UPI00049280F4|nr:hypothetical protein [Verrucomicrobium spinosum]